MKRSHSTGAVLLFVLAAMAVGCGGSTKPIAPGDRKVCTAAEVKPAQISSCYVVTEPYVRYDDPDAAVFNDLSIPLYFFPQTPPENTEVLGPVQAKSVLALDRGTCRETGIRGLIGLQRRAKRAKANAVVNIRATWERVQLGDELNFGCHITKGRYALIWQGTLAHIPRDSASADGVDTDWDAPQSATGLDDDDVKQRLRTVEELYYQGLISREEYLNKRRKILDGL